MLRGTLPNDKAGATCLCFLLMLIVKHYRVENTVDNVKVICSQEPPLCPACNFLMSGYDKRLRFVIRDDGEKETYLLRRFRCPRCKSIHLQIPDCIEPQKHYAAKIICNTISGAADYCPADNSTIRRWKKNPPVLPRK